MLTINNIVIAANLGDPIGGYLGIITAALIVAGAVLLVIGITSIINRK